MRRSSVRIRGLRLQLGRYDVQFRSGQTMYSSVGRQSHRRRRRPVGASSCRRAGSPKVGVSSRGHASSALIVPTSNLPSKTRVRARWPPDGRGPALEPSDGADAARRGDGAGGRVAVRPPECRSGPGSSPCTPPFEMGERGPGRRTAQERPHANGSRSTRPGRSAPAASGTSGSLLQPSIGECVEADLSRSALPVQWSRRLSPISSSNVPDLPFQDSVQREIRRAVTFGFITRI